MPLPYRTSIRLGDDVDVVALAEREVQHWIERRNKIEQSRRAGFISGEFFEPGIHELGGGATLLVAHADRPEDGSRRRILRLTETNAAGQWQVDAVALDYLESGQRRRSLLVEARRLDEPDSDGEVAPPGLVRQLLAEQEVIDGETPVTASPRLIRVADAELVLRAITDPNRSVSVVVAGSPGPRYDEPLRARVESLTSQLTGTASVFVLTQDAIAWINNRLPKSHAVDVGHVRTYMPRVDLESPADGHNHRFLGPGTLARAIAGPRVRPYLRSAFAIQTRGRQLSLPLPSDIRRQRRLIDASLDEVLRSSQESEAEARLATTRTEVAVLEPSTSDVGRTEQPGKQLRGRARQLLERILGTAIEAPTVEDFDAAESHQDRLEATMQTLRAAAVRDRQRLEEEQEGHETLKEEYDFQGLELVEAQDQIDRLSDEVHFLRMEMLKHDLGQQAYSYVRDASWDTPSDLSELALTLLPGTSQHTAAARVVFTGDLDKVLEAQQRDGNGLAVQRAWKAVRALHDYAELKSSGAFVGNVRTYLDSFDHDGYKVPSSWHSQSETQRTMDQWGDERVFMVPPEVDATREATMEAHFRCDTSNTFATRMHYLDDTDGTGNVYIGYIGRHRTNTRTKHT